MVEKVLLSISLLDRHSTWAAGVLGVCVLLPVTLPGDVCRRQMGAPAPPWCSRSSLGVFVTHSVPIRQLPLGWLECSGACMAPAEQCEQMVKRFRVTLSKEALEKGLVRTFHSGSYTVDIFVAFSDKFFVNCICELDKYCCDGLCPACPWYHCIFCPVCLKRRGNRFIIGKFTSNVPMFKFSLLNKFTVYLMYWTLNW